MTRKVKKTKDVESRLESTTLELAKPDEEKVAKVNIVQSESTATSLEPNEKKVQDLIIKPVMESPLESITETTSREEMESQIKYLVSEINYLRIQVEVNRTAYERSYDHLSRKLQSFEAKHNNLARQVSRLETDKAL
jgi:hypothetical protein